ncbi:hypothetical protein EMIHUDRAFT_230719 [Emiliania huxleyi CCMP1516]|uniref:Uncharacterized protein n=2 Tax=Emiliania huxleyi TaxID=2903 RepID=A0A0D3K9X9_EMIH1|nr:hypothetical protein EMIHUDRAFT_230719 [Emiliania huxleyi CCMP1516]EOD32564.1 hypothetical protein EMIHUDRAFT_230719 [Emiliania huxleyi CCMP1516]|eukprot:XP_005784993.1 hypothetical protein EMIHUDRAFT_230719 [Emiliania huxleyi CCMP1516]
MVPRKIPCDPDPPQMPADPGGQNTRAWSSQSPCPCWGGQMSGMSGCPPVRPASGAFREHFCAQCRDGTLFIPASRIRIVEVGGAELANTQSGGVWNEPARSPGRRKRPRAPLPAHRVINQTVCSTGPKLVVLRDDETTAPLPGLVRLSDALSCSMIGFKVGKTLKPLAPLSREEPASSSPSSEPSSLDSRDSGFEAHPAAAWLQRQPPSLCGQPPSWTLEDLLDATAAALHGEASLHGEAASLHMAPAGALQLPPGDEEGGYATSGTYSAAASHDPCYAEAGPAAGLASGEAGEEFLRLLFSPLLSPPASPPEPSPQSPALPPANGKLLLPSPTRPPALGGPPSGLALAIAVPFTVAIFGPRGILSTALETSLANHSHNLLHLALAVPWPCIAYLVQVAPPW